MSVAARGCPRDVGELDERLSEPRDATVDALRRAPGDLVILGGGGKMGPTLARMAARAAERADGARRRRVCAVSRFGDGALPRWLERHGVEAITCDLTDPDAVARLPDAPNVLYLAGQKFGTRDAPSRTWVMNVVVPAYCARRYAGARIVAFSTGNVYPLVPVGGPGASEATPPAPVGEYAASCLGRERVFESSTTAAGTRVAIMRLNYASDLRYGVLTDLAVRVLRGTPIPLAMGYANVIWQGDANRAAIELLPLAAAPPLVLNVTGADVLSVRDAAEAIGRRLGRAPRFEGGEAPTALLSDTARMRSLLPPPELDADTLLDWTTEWVREGRPLLDKPTHFERRDGAF